MYICVCVSTKNNMGVSGWISDFTNLYVRSFWDDRKLCFRIPRTIVSMGSINQLIIGGPTLYVYMYIYT